MESPETASISAQRPGIYWFFFLDPLFVLLLDLPCFCFSVNSWWLFSQRPDETPSTANTLFSYFRKPKRPPLAPDDILLLWVRFWIRKNLPFNLLESSEFREAISATSSFGTEFRLGGRSYMSTTLISRMKNALMTRLRVLLTSNICSWYVSLNCLSVNAYHAAIISRFACCFCLRVLGLGRMEMQVPEEPHIWSTIFVYQQ